MKKNYVGIDISKEKCNLCFRSGLEIVREEECSNDVKALKKAFKAALKVLGACGKNVQSPVVTSFGRNLTGYAGPRFPLSRDRGYGPP